MARLFPTDAFTHDPENQSLAELETLRLLGDKLSNDYCVFHSLHWSDAGKRYTSVGEIDFVVCNRSGDILVIEQKNGKLEECDEGLVKRYPNKRKALNSQIQRNIGGLRTKFAAQHGSEDGLCVDYLIYCPDYRVISVNAAGVDMSRTVDRSSKADLVERITQLLGPGTDQNCGRHDQVTRFFGHTFHVVPDVSAYVGSQDKVYTRMLEGLGDVIDKLEFTPFRLRVIGTAGCGKTQLTLREASRFLSSGSRVLQLCFNRPLADTLRGLVPAGVEVDTYYGFCKATLEALGYDVGEPASNDPEYWRDLQEQLMSATIPDDALYDALIVDEGQDFLQEWWDILELFLKEEASVLWLEDPHQNLRQNSPVHLPGFVTYRENGNFRTPLSIGRFIRSVLDVDFVQKNSLPGLGVHVEKLCGKQPLAKALAHRIGELVKAGFSKDEIVVVSCRGTQSSGLSGCDKVGALSLRRFTGEYCAGAQVYTDGEIYFDTTYRFKGQQAPVVILVDLDDRLDRSERNNHVLYCAMTRATVHLELIVQEDCPWLPEFEANV